MKFEDTNKIRLYEYIGIGQGTLCIQDSNGNISFKNNFHSNEQGQNEDWLASCFSGIYRLDKEYSSSFIFLGEF